MQVQGEGAEQTGQSGWDIGVRVIARTSKAGIIVTGFTLVEDVLSAFAYRLIAWQRQHGRHHLPWQQNRDPYRIWLSEIMLQQTQVSAVIPYYQRFLARFPDLATLAAAPIDDVLEHWAGLGYYARARNLHRCARQIMENHGGVFPTQSATLMELSGIGRSTAAAIAVFSAGERAAILDGNVKRVLCRHAGIEGFPGNSVTEKQLWNLAESLLPLTDIEAYTQGLMDLGATLCTRSSPDCPHCPLSEDCVARQSGRQHLLPTPKSRPALPERQTNFILICDGQRVLLQRRPPTGIWGGLLVPPEGDPATVLPHLGVPVLALTELPKLIHTFSHFRLHITPLFCRISDLPAALHDSSWHWQAIAEADQAALPAPVRKLLARLPA